MPRWLACIVLVVTSTSCAFSVYVALQLNELKSRLSHGVIATDGPLASTATTDISGEWTADTSPGGGDTLTFVIHPDGLLAVTNNRGSRVMTFRGSRSAMVSSPRLPWNQERC